jgi:hypothetical protein
VIPVVDAMHIVPVTMKVEGREEIKTPLGTFKTLRVQPTAAAGVVKNRGNIWIWYTDDERHLPVQMRARLFLGHHHLPPHRQREGKCSHRRGPAQRRRKPGAEHPSTGTHPHHRLGQHDSPQRWPLVVPL